MERGRVGKMAGRDRIVYRPGYSNPRRFFLPVLLVVLVLIVGFAAWYFIQSNKGSYRVVDGDTIEVTEWFSTHKVRLIGIDSPEKYNVAVAECYAKEATEHLEKLLKNHIKISSRDGSQDDKDKYGRLLRYIYSEDGLTNINQQMIADGYAYEYTYNKAYEFQTEFKKAEADAKAAGLGLWATDTCNGQRQKDTRTATADPVEEKVGDNCDPNYSEQCVPIASYDIDCKSIGGTVRVVGIDKHKFDEDGDGFGCEPEPGA